MSKPIVLCLLLSLSGVAVLAQQSEQATQQRRAALRAAVQSRPSGAVRTEPGAVVGRQLSPQEREELRQQLRQQRREALHQSP